MKRAQRNLVEAGWVPHLARTPLFSLLLPPLPVWAEDQRVSPQQAQFYSEKEDNGQFKQFGGSGSGNFWLVGSGQSFQGVEIIFPDPDFDRECC